MSASALPPTPAVPDLEIIQDRAAARCLLHPIRLRIVEHLASPDSSSGIARRLRLPRQKVNYHLKELERHGLVRLVRTTRHGAGTERRLQARARAYALGPRLLGRLAADRALVDEDRPEARILLSLTRAAREIAGASLVPGQVVAVEADLTLADADALQALAEDLRAAVEFLTERYRTESGLACRLVLGMHPAASFAASLPPPIPGAASGPGPTPEDG